MTTTAAKSLLLSAGHSLIVVCNGIEEDFTDYYRQAKETTLGAVFRDLCKAYGDTFKCDNRQKTVTIEISTRDQNQRQ